MSFNRPIFRDIELDAITTDLVVVDGDFRVVETTQREVEYILISEKGNWRENPVLGVGLIRFLNAVGARRELLKKTRLQLEFDNMKVDGLSVADGGQMDVQAHRIK
jgi:hypothetical protein